MIHEYLMDYAANKVRAEKEIRGLCMKYLMNMCRSTRSCLGVKDGEWKFIHRTGNAVDEYIVQHCLPTDPELRRFVQYVKDFINIAEEVKRVHGVNVWEYIDDTTSDKGDLNEEIHICCNELRSSCYSRY